MSETQKLLGKIATLRQRLEIAQGMVREATSAVASLVEESAGAVDLDQLEQHVSAVGEQGQALDRLTRPFGVPALSGELQPLPRQMTARARRVLERAAELLKQLRHLDDAFSQLATPEGDVGPEILLPRSEPLARLYRETLAMTDTAIRMIPLFPDSAAAQMNLCEGVEAMLAEVAVRVKSLNSHARIHRNETETISYLADTLASLAGGATISLSSLRPLAASILHEAQEGAPLRLPEYSPMNITRFIACHSISVARVMARVVRHDADLRSRALDGILAALLFDVGMLKVPAEILGQGDSLFPDQRRVVEAHCAIGASLLAPLHDEAPYLQEAALSHHERLDGTGYPDGLREFQVSSLTRLLAVCDVYTSFCTERPHRPARSSRRALADTLMLAEEGLLDRHHAERLLHLSFYPVGTAVELADGSIGVVVATPHSRRDGGNPTRPVVVLLLNPLGEPEAAAHYLDLAQCDHQSIVRSLSRQERRTALADTHPEWA